MLNVIYQKYDHHLDESAICTGKMYTNFHIQIETVQCRAIRNKQYKRNKIKCVQKTFSSPFRRSRFIKHGTCRFRSY